MIELTELRIGPISCCPAATHGVFQSPKVPIVDNPTKSFYSLDYVFPHFELQDSKQLLSLK